MTDPTAAANGGYAVRSHPVGKTRHPWGVWGLSIITFGIYYLYWWFKINEELKDYDTQIQVSPALALLANFVPICDLVTIVKTGGRISQAQTTADTIARCSGWLGLLLGFLFGLHVVYYQTALNDLWSTGGEVPYGDPPVASGAEAI